MRSRLCLGKVNVLFFLCRKKKMYLVVKHSYTNDSSLFEKLEVYGCVPEAPSKEELQKMAAAFEGETFVGRYGATYKARVEMLCVPLEQGSLIYSGEWQLSTY